MAISECVKELDPALLVEYCVGLICIGTVPHVKLV